MLTLFGSVPGPFGDSRIQQQLEALPKPRIVTVALRDRILLPLGLPLVCLCGAFWTRAIIESWKRQTGWAVFAVSGLLFGVWSMASWLRREIRNRGILKNGECSLGKITSQTESGGRHKRSTISYEFVDLVGRTWKGTGEDLTGEYGANMEVIVFYEPYDPPQNVAISATVWRLRKLDGKLVDIR